MSNHPRRTIKSVPAAESALPISASGSLDATLAELASGYGLRFLLAHFDDGILWGRFDGGNLVTSRDAAAGDTEYLAFTPELRMETLQQARIFGEHAEVFIWRADDGSFRARVIQDSAGGETDYEEAFDEPQILWGKKVAGAVDDGFTLLEEGAMGHRHIIPIALGVNRAARDGRPRLVIRHYLSKEAAARIAASRLVTIQAGYDHVQNTSRTDQNDF